MTRTIDPVLSASGRLPALVSFAVLAAGLVVLVIVTTPWSPLAGHVSGGRLPADPATDFSPSEIAAETAYHSAVRLPAYLSLGVSLAAVLAVGLTSAGARGIDVVARRLGGGWGWQVAVGAVGVLLLARIVALPFDAWVQVVLRRYRLSTQGWGPWLLDLVKASVLGIVLITVGLLAFYALIRALPTAWWAPAAAGAAAVVVAGSFLYPLVIEPVFNKFTPLPAGALRTELLDLAARDHLNVTDVQVVDASRRTTALNAYVSGIGATRRIVIYDTLLSSASPQEIKLVVAHELGHTKAGDVLHGTWEGALGAAAGMCGLFVLLSWAPLLRRAGVSAAGDARSVVLVIAVVMVGMQLSVPAQNLVSRQVETRADEHSLNLTGDPAGFVQMQRRLSVSNLSDLRPNPIVYALFATHPSGPQRIALARDWASRHEVAVPAGLAP